MEQTFIFDTTAVTMLKLFEAGAIGPMDEKWKEMNARWKQFSPETRKAIEEQVLTKVQEEPPPVLLTIRLEIISIVDDIALIDLLQKRLMRFEVIKDPLPYSKFTDVETGQVYFYKGIYTPPSPSLVDFDTM